MHVLGVDFETTSLDTSKANIIEIGACLFSVEDRKWWIEDTYTAMCLVNEPLSQETIDVTGITDDFLQKQGVPFAPALEKLAQFASKAEMCVAHNSPYDKGVLQSVCDRGALMLLPGVSNLLGMHWLCSAVDLKSNKKFKSWKLSHLALDYGVTVDPSILHRAVADVQLMGKMLTFAKADPSEMLAYKLSPSYLASAIIPPPWEDGGKGKDAAVKLGFGWQKARGTDIEIPKTWVKKIKECDLEEERKAAPFQMKIIQPI